MLRSIGGHLECYYMRCLWVSLRSTARMRRNCSLRSPIIMSVIRSRCLRRRRRRVRASSLRTHKSGWAVETTVRRTSDRIHSSDASIGKRSAIVRFSRRLSQRLNTERMSRISINSSLQRRRI